MTRTEWKDKLTEEGFHLLDNPEAQQRAENLFYYVITAICMNDYYKELLNTKHVESFSCMIISYQTTEEKPLIRLQYPLQYAMMARQSEQ